MLKGRKFRAPRSLPPGESAVHRTRSSRLVEVRHLAGPEGHWCADPWRRPRDSHRSPQRGAAGEVPEFRLDSVSPVEVRLSRSAQRSDARPQLPRVLAAARPTTRRGHDVSPEGAPQPSKHPPKTPRPRFARRKSDLGSPSEKRCCLDERDSIAEARVPIELEDYAITPPGSLGDVDVEVEAAGS